MNLHWIDWTIVAALLAFMVFVVVSTKHYMRGVADFLSANRCAGRYLLCVSDGIAGLGAITILAFWEQYYKAGFTAIWWSLFDWPIIFVLALSGFVIYRFRQTRAMTMAQFFEMRYSRRFRIFAGIVCFISGTINFGIFPAVGARFFIYFCGLPEILTVAGLSIGTFPLVMLILLGIALFFTFAGGQIAVILTDFVQGTASMVLLIIACLFLLYRIDWQHLTEGLSNAPEDASFVHPFKTSEIEGFNVWFFLIQWFVWVYAWKAWQGTQAYYSSARTPHEARMSQILGTWRYFAQQMIVPILAVCAIAFYHLPDFSAEAASAQQVLDGIENETVRTQMTVGVGLSRMLPIGIMGGLCAVMFAAFISTHDTYLHSWGSIFIQDVVMPLRKKPLTPKQHLRLLRCSIGGVAVFIFLFSLFFQQTDFIRMFFAITGAIFLGGAGSCIIGGLYWKRGTTVGAWGAMITGIVLACTGLVCQQLVKADMSQHGPLGRIVEYIGSLNGQQISFFAMISAISVYILLSLLLGLKGFNLDRMLHRGEYAVEDDAARGDEGVAARWRWLGVTKEFTRRDRILYLASIGWILLWTVVFIVGTAYNLIYARVTGTKVSDAAWMSFWHFIVWMAIALAIITTVWLTAGGIYDLRLMFRRLRTVARDHADDGTVRDDLKALPSETEEDGGS